MQLASGYNSQVSDQIKCIVVFADADKVESRPRVTSDAITNLEKLLLPLFDVASAGVLSCLLHCTSDDLAHLKLTLSQG